MKYRTMCLIGITLLLGNIRCAESASANAASGVFKVEEVIELALKRNPGMSAAKGGVRQSQGERVAAGAFLNPSINGSDGPGSIRDPSTGVSIVERTVTVEQPLELPGKRRARREAAEADLAGALAGVEEARLNVLADAKVAFYRLLLAQRDVDLSTQNLSTVQEIFQTIKARVDAGQARPFEAVKADVELQRATKELSRAQNGLVAARAGLNAVTAGALGKEFSVRGDFVLLRNDLNLDTLIVSALESHPILRRTAKQIERAEHMVTLEQESRIPFVSITGTYHREAGDEAYIAGLRVPLPLWYRRQGEIEAALGMKDRAEAERVRAENELIRAITEFAQEARTAREQIDVFEKGLLKQAEEALRIARVSFRQGAAGLLDLIDSQRVYRQVQLEYTEARASLSVALARLERWTGELQ
ncbi:MAG: putative cation efflux system protein CzcC [Nitrospira sp. OLB3]|nr:MAG: putative cation efflux system protein CzcC [Nitrospira sp. OLB3]